jgi:hypothetical protein
MDILESASDPGNLESPILRRNLETEESRKFWDLAVRNAQRVEEWPAWKKGWETTQVNMSAYND